jgi:hypothetical protein
MAQLTETLVRDILNGAGCTRWEIEQLCNHYLAALSLPRQSEAVAWQKNCNFPGDWRGPQWEECTKEEHDSILRDGVWINPDPNGLNFPATTRALYTTPQPAQGEASPRDGDLIVGDMAYDD